MKSRLASVRAAGGLDRVDRAVQLLEDEWRRHGEVQLEDFWTDQNRTGAADPDESVGVLAALIKADLRRRFDQGQTPAVCGYLDRFPELRGRRQPRPEPGLRGVLPERRAGHCAGRRVVLRPVPGVEKLAGLAASLPSPVQPGGRSEATSLPRFPEPGEDFEEFHLLSLLGDGGTSRVFLAKDLSLGGKQVALKVTLDRGQEPKAPRGARSSAHRPGQFGDLSARRRRSAGCRCRTGPGLPLDEDHRRRQAR